MRRTRSTLYSQKAAPWGGNYKKKQHLATFTGSGTWSRAINKVMCQEKKKKNFFKRLSTSLLSPKYILSACIYYTFRPKVTAWSAFTPHTEESHKDWMCEFCSACVSMYKYPDCLWVCICIYPGGGGGNEFHIWVLAQISKICLCGILSRVSASYVRGGVCVFVCVSWPQGGCGCGSHYFFPFSFHFTAYSTH